MRYIRAISYEIKSRLFDWTFNPVVGWSLACASFTGFLALRWLHRPTAGRLLLKAHYLLFRTGHFDVTGSRLQRLIEGKLRQGLAESQRFPVTLAEPEPGDARQQFFAIPGGLVLKAPRTDRGRTLERGALLLKNTEQLRVFRHCADVPAILRDYVLVLEPSWSGFAQPDILYFARFTDDPIVVMATGEQDYRFLQRLRTNLVPLSMGASDWVNPAVFRPLEARDKHYDAVMVARWTHVKRHRVLFRALRKLGDPSFRVALIAPTWFADTDRSSIESLMQFYGVAGQITIFEDLRPEAVNTIYNQSKVNLLLSRQEGSNRSLFEGFFADTPGLALERNVGLPKSYFTSQTGKLIDERELADELRHFRRYWQDYEPRSWAQAHITPELTTASLNAVLKSLAQQRGEAWTHDIVAKFNGPDLQYYPGREAGTGLPTLADLLAQYPRIGKAGDSP